jgi:hypothetical protein
MRKRSREITAAWLALVAVATPVSADPHQIAVIAVRKPVTCDYRVRVLLWTPRDDWEGGQHDVFGRD